MNFSDMRIEPVGCLCCDGVRGSGEPWTAITQGQWVSYCDTQLQVSEK